MRYALLLLSFLFSGGEQPIPAQGGGHQPQAVIHVGDTVGVVTDAGVTVGTIEQFEDALVGPHTGVISPTPAPADFVDSWTSGGDPIVVTLHQDHNETPVVFAKRCKDTVTAMKQQFPKDGG